jgi:UDP-N-acetylglucosamine--N-acetylmuramyl-(pentapeptide) pyrophosphoryl-undecaprenol N-acetylglucosamine transferase
LKQPPRAKTKNVIIAGGGTGGHIYPAVAIARALMRDHPEVSVHFVGAYGGLEERIVPRENLPLHLMNIGKLHKSVGLKARLRTLWQLPKTFLQSARLLHELKPVGVLGVGGYASGPLLFVASLMGYRTLIWEPNAHPGLTNRLMSWFAKECLLVFDDAALYLHSKNVTRAGIPVRAAIARLSNLPALIEAPHPLRILVFGGSQGSRALNTVVSEAVTAAGVGGWLDNVQLVHQTGTADFKRVSDLYRNAGSSVECVEYFHDMENRYAWADLVICRSGASTVAEICAARKATIFIPLPTAADDHQLRNAEVLARANAARLVLQKDFTPETFRSLILEFRDHRERIAQLEANVGQFYFPDADRHIAERLLALN